MGNVNADSVDFAKCAHGTFSARVAAPAGSRRLSTLYVRNLTAVMDRFEPASATVTR
jgi:hypothetical protein